MGLLNISVNMAKRAPMNKANTRLPLGADVNTGLDYTKLTSSLIRNNITGANARYNYYKGLESDYINGLDDNPSIVENATKIDYGLGAFETGASIFQAIQAITAKPPMVSRVPAPQINMPEFYDTTAAAQAGIKENLATTANTVLERAKETGQYNLPMATSIMSAASMASNKGNIALSQQRQTLLNQIAQTGINVESRNATLSYQAAKDYQARKDQIIMADAVRRSQQLSAAISNMGGIASRLMNDALYSKILTNKR